MIIKENILNIKNRSYASKVFILLLFSVHLLNAEMITNPASGSDTIKMGICLVDLEREIYDSLETTFIIDNQLDTDIKIGDSHLSFAIKLLEGYPDEFQEFGIRGGDIPSIIGSGEKKEIMIKYFARQSLIAYPPGKKHCAVRLGIYDPDNVSDPLNESDMIEFKDFIIIAKKTIKYIDSFDEVVNFDTVYVKPPQTLEKLWKAENLARKDIRIEAELFLRINPDAEIDYYGYGFDYNFPRDTTKDYRFTYYPENPGPDSAIMILRYKPHPVEHPDSTDETQIKVQGFGAQQNLSIVNVEGGKISGDTIDLGNVKAGTDRDVIVSVRNDGNIPFGAISEGIYKNNFEIEDENFTLLQYLFASGEYLKPGIVRSFTLRFSAPIKGDYLARYELESDIKDRHIYGYPRSAEKVIFYIKAKAIEPIISFADDTVDFGNIVIHRDCPTRRDTSVFIANAGNTDLRIADIYLQPQPPSPFHIDIDNLEIPAGEQKLFNISFSTQAQSPDTLFQWKLVFVSNSTSPLDTFELNLKARGIEPYPVDISLPDLRSKTGRVLTFPINVEKDRIWRARTFDCKLSYNNTLLRYHAHQSFGTGSDGAKSIEISEDIEKQELSISIEMPAGTNFGFSDTLIFLRFSTYLGNERSTPITFLNTIFGDGNCPKALNPNIKNGSFTLDSICGLEHKTVALPDEMYFLSKVNPNPAENKAAVFFHTPIDAKVEISVYNSFGNKVLGLEDSFLAKGDYERNIDCSSLSPGVYLIYFRALGFTQVERFVVAK